MFHLIEDNTQAPVIDKDTLTNSERIEIRSPTVEIEEVEDEEEKLYRETPKALNHILEEVVADLEPSRETKRTKQTRDERADRSYWSDNGRVPLETIWNFDEREESEEEWYMESPTEDRIMTVHESNQRRIVLLLYVLPPEQIIMIH